MMKQNPNIKTKSQLGQLQYSDEPPLKNKGVLEQARATSGNGHFICEDCEEKISPDNAHPTSHGYFCSHCYAARELAQQIRDLI